MRTRRTKRAQRPGTLILWIAALACLLVSTAALAPHDESEDRSCVVCKAGSQPFQQTATAVVPGIPSDNITTLPAFEVRAEWPSPRRSRSPRAPPA